MLPRTLKRISAGQMTDYFFEKSRHSFFYLNNLQNHSSFRLQYSRQHHHSTNTDFERFHHGADFNDLSIVTMPTTLQVQVGQEEAR